DTGPVVLEDAERFVRPVDRSARNMPAKTARPTQGLSGRHKGRAAPQLLFRALAPGDVGDKGLDEEELATVVVDGPPTGQHPDALAVLAIELALAPFDGGSSTIGQDPRVSPLEANMDVAAELAHGPLQLRQRRG